MVRLSVDRATSRNLLPAVAAHDAALLTRSKYRRPPTNGPQGRDSPMTCERICERNAVKQARGSRTTHNGLDGPWPLSWRFGTS